MGGHPEAVQHGLGRGELGMVVKVRVDVRCGAEITVSQPFLDLLHRNAVGQQKAGTAVSKVVQSNDTHRRSVRRGDGHGSVQVRCVDDFHLRVLLCGVQIRQLPYFLMKEVCALW